MKAEDTVRGKTAFLFAVTVLLLTGAAAQTGITLYGGSDMDANGNDIKDLGTVNPNGTNLTVNATYVNFQNNSLNNISSIENYYDSACGAGSVVQDVYSNGSFKCIDIDEASGVEGLPATLAENNTADRAIVFGSSTAIKIGNGSMGTGSVRDIVIGKNASIVSSGVDEAVAIGFKADGSNGSVTIGDNSETTDDDATAIGPGAFAKGDATVALGYTSETDANNAVALGRNTFAGGSGGSQLALIYNANASGDAAIAQGYNSSVTANNSVAIGRNTNVTSYDSVAFGRDAAVNMQDSVAIGEDSLVQSGAYDSIAIGEGAEAQDYQTIAIGDTAIAEFDGAVAIGEGAVASERSVTIGKQSESNGYWSVAIGKDSVSDGIQSVAIGDQTWSAQDAVALGRGANASSINSTSIGALSSASAEGAVSIGNNARAPNSNEATFGNLNGDELDVNVTGNLTVHGSGGIDMQGTNAKITNYYDSACSGTDLVQQVYPNGSFECVDVDDVSTVEDLNQTLNAGNNAQNQSIKNVSSVIFKEGVVLGSLSSSLGSNAILVGSEASAAASEGVAIGFRTNSTAESAVAVGSKASVSAENSLALGQNTNVTVNSGMALGANSRASAERAIAIGEGATAPNPDEATFGSNDNPIDVNVTGGVTVHGSEGVDLQGNRLDNVSQLNVSDSTLEVDSDVKLVDSNPEVSLGNGMSMKRENGNLVISD